MRTQITLTMSLLVLLAAGAARGQEPTAQTGGVQLNANPINIHVIGFDVDADTTDQLTQMAQAGGGRYYPAANEAELVAALGAATGIALQPHASQEQEDNNTLGRATPIAPTGSVRGSIDPKGDHDWYVVDLERQGMLELRVTDVPAALDVHVRVFNAERGLHENWIAPLRAGAELERIVYIAGPGRHYLQVVDGNDDASDPSPYTLSVQYTPGDAFEPNNSFGAATALATDAEVFASILPKGDEDWYVCDVPRRGALHVSITQPPPELAVQFRVFNAEGGLLRNWVTPLRAGADTVGVVDLPEDGRYYLQIVDAGGAASPDNYRLQLRFEPGDDSEPNENLGRATLVDASSQWLASILPAGDQDWYRFRVDHPGIVDVQIGQVPADLALHFRVFNGERGLHLNWVNPLRAGADAEATVDLPAAGWYYLQIAAVEESTRSADLYALTLAYQRADAHEPNNSFGMARPIGLGAAVQGSILPRGDQDWYMLELDAAGTLDIAVTDVPAALDVHVRVFDADGGLINNWIAPLRAGAETRGQVEVRSPGRVYLQVIDGGDDARAVEPYTLTVQRAP
jgi:hypothetical protein